MGPDIELSIEETNKLRAKIGLPLIPVPGKSDKTQADQKELNVNQTNTLRASLGLRPLEHDGRQDASRPQKLPNAVTDANLAKKVNRTDDFFYNQVDTAQWLDMVGQKRAIEDNVEEIVKGEDEAEVEVAHDSRALSALADGDVLTLQDQGLLDEANDVLFNATLAKSDKLKQDELEKKKAARIVFGPKISYDLDEEDIDNGPIVIKSSTIQLSELASEPKVEKRAKAALLFGETEGDVKMVPIKMKKLKTKSSKLKRKADDVIIVPQKMVTTTLHEDEDNDDNELEALFAASRLKKLKQRKIMTAEEIAREVNSHLRTDAVEKIDGFVYDNTQDFFNFLPAPQLVEPETKDSDSYPKNPQVVPEQPISQILNVEEEILDHKTTGNESQDIKDDKGLEKLADPTDEAVQKSEPTLNSLLDTLRYLRQTNTVSESSDSQKLAERQQREAQKAAQLAKIQISIEERMVREELEKDSQYVKMTSAEKESVFDRILNERLVHKGIVSDLKKQGKYSTYAKKDRLADYNPQVKVSYKDEKGNLLDKKQAWKQLLHQYHGLAPKHKKEITRAKTDSVARDIHPTIG